MSDAVFLVFIGIPMVIVVWAIALGLAARLFWLISGSK